MLAVSGLLLVSAMSLVGGGICTEMFWGLTRDTAELDADTVAAQMAIFNTMAWVWAGAGLAAGAVAVAGSASWRREPGTRHRQRRGRGADRPPQRRPAAVHGPGARRALADRCRHQLRPGREVTSPADQDERSQRPPGGAPPRCPRDRRWSIVVLVTSWSLAGLAILLVPFTEPTWHVGQWYGLVDTADAIVFGAVASVLLARGRHPVSWLVALCAVGGGLAALGLQWSMLVMVHPDLPQLPFLQSAQNWAWLPGTYAMIILVPVLVRPSPDGDGRAGVRGDRRRGDHRADADAPHRSVPVARRAARRRRSRSAARGGSTSSNAPSRRSSCSCACWPPSPPATSCGDGRSRHRAQRRGLGWLAVASALMTATFIPLALPAVVGRRPSRLVDAGAAPDVAAVLPGGPARRGARATHQRSRVHHRPSDPVGAAHRSAHRACTSRSSRSAGRCCPTSTASSSRSRPPPWRCCSCRCAAARNDTSTRSCAATARLPSRAFAGVGPADWELPPTTTSCSSR